MRATRTATGSTGAIVVGEPTSNDPLVGHEGSVKFYARFRGVAAHGSMPHLGVNAVYTAARAVARLEAFDFGVAPYPVMGAPTLNVGTLEGGSGINLVPDAARVGVDMRTAPGADHAALLERLAATIGEEAELEVVSDLEPVWTEPGSEWVARVFEICTRVRAKAPEPRTAP